MQFKILKEELSAESKTQFKKLIHKFHPDKKGGDKKIAQELIKAKDSEDEEKIKKLFNKHFGTSDKERISLSTYADWADKLAKKYNITSIVKKRDEKIEVSLSSSKGYQVFYDAQKYEDKEKFQDALYKFMKSKGLI